MSMLKTLALLCAALLSAVCGGLPPASAQEKPPAAQPPTPASKPHPEVQSILDEGDALKKKYAWADSLNSYNAALAKAIALLDKTGEAKAHLKIGIIYYSTGQLQKALAQYQQALTLYKTVNAKAGEASALTNIGNVYYDTGLTKEALEQYQQAVPLFRMVGDKTGEAQALGNIGNHYYSTGEPQKALEQYQQVLLLFKTIGDRAGEASTLLNMGSIYATTGVPQKALAQYQQALTLYKTINAKAGEASALTNIGNVYSDTGQSQKALEQYQQALPLFRMVGDKRSGAVTLLLIGIIYYSTGELQKALEQYQRAQALFTTAGDKSGEARALNNIGAVYYDTGLPQKALEQYQQAQTLYQTIGEKFGEANTLSNIGLVYSETGLPREALAQYQQALPIFKAVGDRTGEANTLSDIGTVYAKTGLPQKALAQYQQALLLFKTIGDLVGEARALGNMGTVYSDTGQPQKALANYQQALPLVKAVGNRYDEATALGSIGIVYADTGQPQKALAQYRQAIILSEKYRENIGSVTESKQAYLQTRLGFYHRALALLLQQQQLPEAFALAQKVKARSLLDEIKASKLDLERDLTYEEQTQLAMLRKDLARLNKEQIGEALRSPDKQTPRFKELTTLVAHAQDQLADFRADLYRKRPQLAQQQAAVTLNLPGVARLLTPNTALLEYVTQQADLGKGKKLDRTLLFVVTLQNGKPNLSIFPIPLTRNMLGEKSDDLYAACSDKSLRSWEGKAAELYRLLIAPAQKQLAGKTRLLVCPDGPLWQVPFAALLDQTGKTLWERYELSFAYSATGAWAAQEQWRNPARPHSGKSLLVVANPDFGDMARFGTSDGRPIDMPSRDLFTGQRGGLSPLPGTKAEADTLQQEFPDSTVLTGKEAQEATVKREAGAYRYLHFATHGLFNPNAPMLSFLAMAEPDKDSSEDGFLTAREIYDLKLSADLAVLSACNTGRGEQKAGEGIVGLTWALQAAGCPSCVVSQWSVDDAATATLMSDLYRGLKAGKSTASALRAAALKLHSDGSHAHPYYWAAFLLFGKGR